MATNARKIILICALLGAFFVIYTQLPPGSVTLENLQARHQALLLYCQQAPRQSAALYFILYVLVTTLSLPGAALLTLLGGALFGLWPGILLVSFASTLGATLAMLVSRYLLRDWVCCRLSPAGCSPAFPERLYNRGHYAPCAFLHVIDRPVDRRAGAG
jgi:uncharacterized membrane protein YdjX (TVP38/TMEM64 family)